VADAPAPLKLIYDQKAAVNLVINDSWQITSNGPRRHTLIEFRHGASKNGSFNRCAGNDDWVEAGKKPEEKWQGYILPWVENYEFFQLQSAVDYGNHAL